MSRTTCQKSLTRTAGYLVVSLLPHPLCSQCVSRTRPSTGSPFSITSSTLLHVQATHAKTTPKRQRTQKKKNAKSKEKEQWRWKVKSSSPCQPYESSKQKREYFSRNRRKRTKQNKKKNTARHARRTSKQEDGLCKDGKMSRKGSKKEYVCTKIHLFSFYLLRKSTFLSSTHGGKTKKKTAFFVVVAVAFPCITWRDTTRFVLAVTEKWKQKKKRDCAPHSVLILMKQKKKETLGNTPSCRHTLWQ